MVKAARFLQKLGAGGLPVETAALDFADDVLDLELAVHGHSPNRPPVFDG